MIRNLIDGVDVPIMEMHDPLCFRTRGSIGSQRMDLCSCPPGWPRLVVDVRQQRLEHQKCPNCPTTLRGDFGPKGWFTCRCCQRAWRRRKDGYYDEQVPLDIDRCTHLEDMLAGSPQGPDRSQ